MPGSSHRAGRWTFAAIAVLLLPVMVLASRDFGVTWDEGARHRNGERVWRYLTGSRGPRALRARRPRLRRTLRRAGSCCRAPLNGGPLRRASRDQRGLRLGGRGFRGRFGGPALRHLGRTARDGAPDQLAAVLRRLDEQPEGPAVCRSECRRALRDLDHVAGMAVHLARHSVRDHSHAGCGPEHSARRSLPLWFLRSAARDLLARRAHARLAAAHGDRRSRRDRRDRGVVRRNAVLAVGPPGTVDATISGAVRSVGVSLGGTGAVRRTQLSCPGPAMVLPAAVVADLDAAGRARRARSGRPARVAAVDDAPPGPGVRRVASDHIDLRQGFDAVRRRASPAVHLSGNGRPRRVGMGRGSCHPPGRAGRESSRPWFSSPASSMS